MNILSIFIILLNTFAIINAHGLSNMEPAAKTTRFNLEGVSDEEKIHIIRSYLAKYVPDGLLLDRICEINDQLTEPIRSLSQQCYETVWSEQLSDLERIDIIRDYFIRPDNNFHHDEHRDNKEAFVETPPCEISSHSMDSSTLHSEQCYKRVVAPNISDTRELTPL